MKVGIVGIGFMGWIHWLSYKQVPGAEVVAICEANPKRLTGDWTDIKGNFGPPGEHVDLSEIRTYSEIDEIVADPEIDVIDICLPPSLHLKAVEAAAAAGKQVFCEKPLALGLPECEAAVQACQAAGVQLMVGHVLPFLPEYAAARKAIDSGQYGSVIGGHFKRIISDPSWLPDFYDPQRVGGPLIDLHIHDAHFIRLLFGMPKEVTSSGRLRGEVVSFCNSIFRFEDSEKVVSSSSGVIDQQGRGFTHGFELYLERATLQFELAVLGEDVETMPLKILNSDGEIERPDLGDGDMVAGFVAEINEVAQSIERGTASSILSGELAHDAVKLCQAESQAVQSAATVVLGAE